MAFGFSKDQLKELLRGGVLEAQVTALSGGLELIAAVMRKRAPWRETRAQMGEILGLAKALSRKLQALTAMAEHDLVARDVGEYLQTALHTVQENTDSGLAIIVNATPSKEDPEIKALIDRLNTLVAAAQHNLQHMPDTRDGPMPSGGNVAVFVVHQLLCIGWYHHSIGCGQLPSSDPGRALSLAVRVCFEAVGSPLSPEWALRNLVKSQAAAEAEFWKTKAAADLSEAGE